MTDKVADLEYSELPSRAARLLAAEAEKDELVNRRVEEFRWVTPREPNQDGDTEEVHGTVVTHHFVDAPGDSETLRWHYVEAGQGEPVVLLHGLPESWYMWNRQIADLAQTHRVIAPDLKGFGQSDKRTGDYRHEGVADQMLAMFDEIGLDTFNVASHDRGTVQADYLLANHPERVLRYARGEQHLFHFNPELAPQQLLYSHPDTNGLMRDPVFHVLRSYMRLTVKPIPDDHIVRTIQEWSWPDLWWAVPRYFNSSSFRKEWIDRRTRLLEAWRCPVTIMQARTDARQPYEFYEDAAEYIPNSPSVAVRIIEGGHFFHIESPEETSAAISELLKVPLQ